MIEELKKFSNKSSIVFLPQKYHSYYESILFTLENVLLFNKANEDKNIIMYINNSKVKKIYLFGYDDLFHFIIPKVSKKIEICWIFPYEFSSLSDKHIRDEMNTIMEYYDRELIGLIGCLNIDNKIVFENAGYKCEYIDLKIKRIKSLIEESNSIGILSNDFDPNNNFYNQMAALTFIKYDVCKYKSTIKATKGFSKYFNLKEKTLDNIEEVMQNNFVNLYINFTNTNKELIMKSYNYGVPVIVGNTDFYNSNKYLKEHLVIKSDDDINEIVEKIKFVKNNYQEIMEEYSKI